VSSDYSVGDLVAEFIERCNVDTVFGIVSIHNLPMLDAIGRRNAVRFVMARGETGAAHMADGFARATGGLGVVFSSTGPGAANAVPGLVEARFASSPVLHITGDIATKYSGRDVGAVHGIPDQPGMLGAVSKAAFRVKAANEAFAVLARAASLAMTEPRGPVSVEIPIDLQSAKLPRPGSLDFFDLPAPSDMTPSQGAMDELSRRVALARRPMLWLGAGARLAGDQVRRLLDLGFGMVTSWAGRGVVPEDHPQNIGSFTGYGMPEVLKLYESCDLMLVVGSRLRAHETGDFSIPLPRPLLQIDVDPSANSRSYVNDGFFHGAAGATLQGLLERLDGSMDIDPGFVDEVKATRQAIRDNYRETLGPYRDFPSILRDAVPRDAIWARDITTSNSSWGNRLFPVYGPHDNIYPISAGIGQGLPLGLGAAVGSRGRKTVILTGDGGFHLAIAELWTAVQERLDVIILLMNDRGYGVIRQLQDVMAEGRHFFTDLGGPDIADMAASSGIPHWRIGSDEEFADALAQAVAVTGPSIVEVDIIKVGAIPPYYPFNQMKGARKGGSAT
jgi:acetolactate synthase-1/2/3 large subunit